MLIIVSILIAASIVFAGWKSLVTKKWVKNLNINSIQQQDQYGKLVLENDSETSNWNFLSSEFGFSLKYPSDRVTLFCQEEPSQPLVKCNGLAIIKRGATRQIDGPSGANYDTDFMSVTV